MRRIAVLLAVSTMFAGPLLEPSGAQSDPVAPCGLTTLDGTVTYADDDRDGRPDEGSPLRCAGGRATVVREELAAARPGREHRQAALGSWINIADVQLADEESPLRGEWADKCQQHPGKAAFRPHETMVPHLLNAHIQAAAAIAAAGTPKLNDEVDFVVGLGDLADNQQLNEVRLIIDLFDGAKLVDPDSGADGYDGVQARDPRGSEAGLPSADEGGPPKGERILDLANEPFWAHGLTTQDRVIPWYSLPGNHDVKVQGTVPDDDPAWRAFVRRYAVGQIKVMDLAPDYQHRLCEALEQGDEAELRSVITDILGDPQGAGTTARVAADDDRLPLYRSDEAKQAGDQLACEALTGLAERCASSWVEEHLHTTGLPGGHGYAEVDDPRTDATENGRCTDDNGRVLARACYSFTHGPFHFVGLDTTPASGRESGAIDEAQWRWLQRELEAHSSQYYTEAGTEVDNPAGRDKLIVVLTHHTIGSTTNEIPIATGQHSGAELKRLLLRFPNVVLQASGHTHENRIYAYEDPELGTGYWEVNTAAVVDTPHQSRVIEVADNRDGTLSIFATVFDALVPPDPRAVHWTAHDHTQETDHGAARNINESWLASFGREVGYYDPQNDLSAIGADRDFNVELLIEAPQWLRAGLHRSGSSDATARE